MPGIDGNASATVGPFSSFTSGGFEGGCFRFWDGRQVDSIASSAHDRFCSEDYLLLKSVGVTTVRDSFRWPLIERTPGNYAWTSIEPMIAASVKHEIQVIWGLCHFGIPECVDVNSRDFPVRFAEYAGEAAKLVRALDPRPQWWCPINEISYWAEAAGALAYMEPVMPGQAAFLKEQFVRAYIAAQAAILSVDERSRFLATDPLTCVSNDDGSVCEAERVHGYEAWDMLCGLGLSESPGKSNTVDAIGVNYYSNNQWMANNREPLGMGQRGYRPLRLLLEDLWQRYGKPIMISETGAEGVNLLNWLAYVEGEVKSAQRAGIPVTGICVYPVMDYRGWVDGRHCSCGLIELDRDLKLRTIRPAVACHMKQQDNR